LGNMINIIGLSKRYSFSKGWALKDVSLQIPPGRIYGLIGENGAGKTTLLRVLLGLITPTRGRVKLPAGLRFGYVPEQPAVYTTLRVGEQLRLMGGLAGLGGRRMHKRVEHVLGLVGLGDQAGTRTGSLSRGMLQRLSIAQALVDNPDLLVMDEPATGLDPAGQKEIKELIVSLNRQGKTILFSSHYLLDIQAVCHRAGILHKGGLVMETSMETLALNRRKRLQIETDATEYKLGRILGELALDCKIDGGKVTFDELTDASYFSLMGLFNKHNIRALVLRTPDLLLEEVFLAATARRGQAN
jgi:ABC-2 type transport system ATP-binding protein